MRNAVVAILAGALLAGAAQAGEQLVEQGYERGALGVAAIQRGDWKVAEASLNRLDRVRADDPARLINLGRVYMATGRPGMALSAWRLAAASNRPFEVETGDGRIVSSRDLAEELLRRHDRGVQSAGVAR